MKALVLALLLFCLPSAPLVAGSDWTSFDVPSDRESLLIGDLESKGTVAIGWSNAVVEISGFGPLVVVPLHSLGDRLTPPDPRWDPWLSSLKPNFLPRAAVSRIWVASADAAVARNRLEKDLVNSGTPAEARTSGPRQTTGWMLVAVALMYLSLRAAAQMSVKADRRRPAGWLWVILPLALGLAGWSLTRTSAGRESPRQSSAVTWSRHLWFQQTWPYGSTWKDWKAGQPWTYDRFERKDGKIVATPTLVPNPAEPGSKVDFAGLDPHHAARIFGPENP